VFVTTLHPDVMGRRLLWRRGEGVAISEAPYDILQTDTYLRSPVPVVFTRALAIRRRIEDPDCPNDYDIVDELRAEGVTDYLIQPLPFTDGEVHAISWTTARPGGFGDDDLAALERVRLPYARVAEIHALRRIATTLLNTYVGRDAGERILQGRIRRGDIERIHAVILLSDLRGFTGLSDRLPGEAVIRLLNGYFDCLVPPIEAHGGEVLKFMGDGLLGIFPVAAGAAAACRAALAAARDAGAALARTNAERAGRAEPELRYGLALHLGEVLYGNIGSAGRLDFTTIGPAVNLTARLETLARDLGQDLVASTAFARHCPEALRSLGTFRLRGFQAPEEVFAPADDPTVAAPRD
jgi:adenylate cyclase